MPLHVAVEGVLFYKAGAIKKSELLKLFNCTSEEFATAIQTLTERLASGGTRLLETETHLQLVTAPELDELIESLRRDELRRDIGKAGAETLAIVLYKGPVTRAEIDRIRGVNSSFILRNLQVRGLVERSTNAKGHTYNITPDLMAHLGLGNKVELPDYAAVLDQLEKFEHEEAKTSQDT